MEYDLQTLREKWRPTDLVGRIASLWRYSEILPVSNPEATVTLDEGWTPLLTLERAYPGGRVLLKDEGRNPTGSFKARGSSVTLSRARELGVNDVVIPTAGSGGSSIAAYAALAGIRAHIVMVSDSDDLARGEVSAYGADLHIVDGGPSDAFRIAESAATEHGWLDLAAMREPYRVEGKKTIGLELAEQLNWGCPDVIIIPTGSGVGLIGIAKAFRELIGLGWLEGPGPRLFAIQLRGCAPVVDAIDAGATSCAAATGPLPTIAKGILVPKPFPDRLLLAAIRDTGGGALAVSASDAIAAMRRVAKVEGILVSAEGGVALAGLDAARRAGILDGRDRVVIINTASGLRQPDLWPPADVTTIGLGGHL